MSGASIKDLANTFNVAEPEDGCNVFITIPDIHDCLLVCAGTD